MIATSARLLELLSLLQARRQWTGAELAQRLEVGPRTIRRDVERLRGLGYPIQAAPGIAGGYRLGAGAAMPPLLLDGEEAVAIAVVLRTAASSGISGIEETAISALAKLEQLLPAPLRRRVSSLSAATVHYPVGGPVVSAEVLARIAGAARDSERLQFGYRDYAGQRSRREVEPHRLVHTGRRWYLVAWDANRADWRSFRVDRIDPPLGAGKRFVPRKPPARDIAAYVAQSISRARDRYQAQIVLRAPLGALTERIPAAYGTLEAIDAHSCLLRVGSDWLAGLAVYVANLGVDFEVLEPPELVAEVAVLARRFARAVDQAGRAVPSR